MLTPNSWAQVKEWDPMLYEAKVALDGAPTEVIATMKFEYSDGLYSASYSNPVGDECIENVRVVMTLSKAASDYIASIRGKIADSCSFGFYMPEFKSGDDSNHGLSASTLRNLYIKDFFSEPRQPGDFKEYVVKIVAQRTNVILTEDDQSVFFAVLDNKPAAAYVRERQNILNRLLPCYNNRLGDIPKKDMRQLCRDLHINIRSTMKAKQQNEALKAWLFRSNYPNGKLRNLYCSAKSFIEHLSPDGVDILTREDFLS